jgi:hypothetical protein
MGNPPIGVQREHAIGDTLQDSFNVAAALLQSHVGGGKFLG